MSYLTDQSQLAKETANQKRFGMSVRCSKEPNFNRGRRALVDERVHSQTSQRFLIGTELTLNKPHRGSSGHP
jgi:hypothetical protein